VKPSRQDGTREPMITQTMGYHRLSRRINKMGYCTMSDFCKDLVYIHGVIIKCDFSLKNLEFQNKMTGLDMQNAVHVCERIYVVLN